MGNNKRKSVENESSFSSSSSEDEEVLRLRRKLKKLKKKIKKRKTYNSDLDESPVDKENGDSDVRVETNFPNDENFLLEDNTEGAEEDPLLAEIPDEGTSLKKHVLYILGQDETGERIMGSKIHKDVSSQWEKTLLTGLSEEIRQKLISKYPTPENCILLAPPKLNPEAKLASMESAIKRDERLQAVQRQIGASVAALGKLLTALLSAEEKEEGAYLEWIGLTGDACRLLTDLHCQQSEARKSLLNLNFRKELKDVILEARSDEFLFGKNLSDRIKEAKAMERSGLDLKQKKTPTLQRKPFSQNQGNYKSPPKRRPPPRLGGQTSFYQQQYRKGSTQYRHSTTQNKGLYRSTRQK